jgi:hypothetical protein
MTVFLPNSLQVIIHKLPYHSLLCSLDIYSIVKRNTKKTPWSESANELYRPSDRRLSAKLVPTFADRGCHVVRVTDPTAVFSVF